MELKIQNLTKSFGSQIALSHISLELTAGCVAVLGPNGSGKTTLLRCLATLEIPNSGQLWFDGYPYATHLQLLRSQMGYLPQELNLPDHLTIRRLLNYLAILKKSRHSEQIEDLIYALGLGKVANNPLPSLSNGQMRLLGIAQAFLGKPTLLLLDEPTRGLDIEEKQRFFSLLRQHVASRLVLYSTHDPQDINQKADRVIILYRGQVVFFGEVGDLNPSDRIDPKSHNNHNSCNQFFTSVIKGLEY